MNLPIILAIASAGNLAILAGSTYLEPTTPVWNMSEVASVMLFYPSPVVKREHHPTTFTAAAKDGG